MPAGQARECESVMDHVARLGLKKDLTPLTKMKPMLARAHASSATSPEIRSSVVVVCGPEKWHIFCVDESEGRSNLKDHI
jgi:hypothetical protein